MTLKELDHVKYNTIKRSVVRATCESSFCQQRVESIAKGITLYIINLLGAQCELISAIII